MQDTDRIRILHMIDAGESAQSFIAERQRADLDQDQMLLFAVVRAIEVIGEAAGKVSAEARASLPAIPWNAVVSMRNRLIHGYFDIDTEIVWKTVTNEIPELLRLLRQCDSAKEKGET
ncbi:DUF86 domain-containing protein [Uliginosibacterium flavum]|uniref:HepT-like ribonuclease domain-containing protein n=1 Tax=Uliginosibacterium flavum TaxID=1396831 RepID=A0ABV2TPF2_9RHOO